MKNFRLIFVLGFLLTLGTLSSAYSQVDVNNRVEYSSEDSFADENSIDFSVKAKRKKVKEEEISMDDLNKVANKSKTHYRKRRGNGSEKCFKAEVKKSCAGNKKLNRILKRNKKK